MTSSPDAGAFATALRDSTARRPLDRMLDADLKLWLADDLLMKMDKMSMAASIEARVPLLDHPLVEWAARIPDRHKIQGLEGKVLLKRLARWNRIEARPAPLDAAMHETLRTTFAGDIARLSDLVGRDLRHWLAA